MFASFAEAYVDHPSDNGPSILQHEHCIVILGATYTTRNGSSISTVQVTSIVPLSQIEILD